MISGIASDNYPLWFLVAYFISKSVYDLINTIISRLPGKITQQQKVIVEIVLVLSVSVLAYLYIQNKPLSHSVMRFDTGLFLTPLFTVGRYLPRAHMLDKSTKITLAVFTVALVTSVVSSVFLNSFVSVCSNEFGNIALFFTSTVSGSIVLFIICKQAERLTAVNRLLSTIGKKSLAIMSTHAFVLYGIEATFMVLNIRGFIPIWVNVPICIGLLLPCLPMITNINKSVQDKFVRICTFAYGYAR